MRSLQAVPWSVRCIFKVNESKNINYLEIKKMAPTIAGEGVLGSYRVCQLPHVNFQDASACPFARCQDVAFDADLGVALVAGTSAMAVRILVTMKSLEEDAELAVPDAQHLDFRVTRSVHCALSDDIASEYILQAAGVSQSV